MTRITIAGRPEENQDPWYSTRTGYDNSMEYHLRRSFNTNNPIPAGSHLDTMVNPEDQGAYYILAGNPVDGVPIYLHQTTLLEITGGVANTTTQRLINSHGITWRKRHPSATGVINWGEWHIAAGHRYSALDPSLHINELIRPEHAGSWFILAGSPIRGLPFTLTQTTVFTLEFGGSVQMIQTLTDRHIKVWRKRDPGGGWGPWRSHYTSLSDNIRAVEMNSQGVVQHAVGDIHARMDHGIASITKVLSCIVAMDIIRDPNTSAQITHVQTVDYNQDRPIELAYSAPLRNGDRVSYHNLMRLALMPSDNMAPMTLARTIGTHLPSPGSGYDRFVKAMNDKLIEMGIHGASASQPTSRAMMSPYDVCKMLVYMHNNSGTYNSIISIMSSQSANFTITDSSGNRRDHTATNAVLNSFTYVPEADWGKGGNHFGRTHLAIKWVNQNNADRFTVMLDSATGISRVNEFRKLIIMSNTDSFPNTLDTSGVTRRPELWRYADVNDIRWDSEYLVPLNAVNSQNITNLPATVSPRGLLKTVTWQSQNDPFGAQFAQQEYRAPNHYWIRSTNSNRAWQAWQRLL